MRADPNFERAAKGLLLLLILSFAVSISGRFMPLLAPGKFREIALSTQFFGGVWAFLSVMVHIAVGIWLWTRAKAVSRSKFTWLGLGIFGGIGAAALYLLIPIYENLVTNPRKKEQANDIEGNH